MLRLALILLAAFAPVAALAKPATPLPFVATYSVHYRGLYAGELHLELSSDGAEDFVYESRAEPGRLASLFVDDQGFERSVLHIDAQGVRPLFWIMNHGREGADGVGVLDFRWEEGTVRGTVEGERVELPTEPGLQDRLSIQIAVMTALQRGTEPGTIPMLDRDEIKRYSYTRVGRRPFETSDLEIETVVYESTRPGSDRVARVWHAPILDYIPVLVEQVRGGRVETVMTLVRVVAK